MKIFALVILALVAYAAAKPQNTYTTKYDKINLDDIVKNQRLLKTYVSCLLDKGPCRPDAMDLKKLLPEALQTGCAKCTEAQRNGSRKMIRHLINNKREWWNALEAKYDPKKTYVNKYRQELIRDGIKLD